MSNAALVPPPGEYENRIAAVRREIAEAGAEALVVDCVEHMAYLFGYAPPAAVYQPALLPRQGPPIVMVRALDLPMFTEQSWVTDTVVVTDDQDPVTVLADTITRSGLATARIAIELDSHFLPVARFRALESRLPGTQFVDFSDRIRGLRLIKSDYEIALLRECARISDLAFAAAIDTAAAGVSERDCAAAFYATAMKEGADSHRCALIASGKRSDSLHGRLGNHVLESGDILHVEAVPLYRGYAARLMRSTVIGPPSAEQARAAQQLLALQDQQFAAMRPGVPAGQVDRILRDGVLRAGLRRDYDNITGYTLGFIGLPVTSDFTRVFRADSDWVLQSRMVFHMYTWAAGMAFSDTVLVTDAGAELLTRTPRRLFTS